MNDTDPSDDQTSAQQENDQNLIVPAHEPSVADDKPQQDRRAKAVMGVPIEVVVCVGKARPLLSDLVNLRRDSILSLDSKIEDPVEVMVGDKVIARGELQELDEQTGQLGLRLTEVADLRSGF